MTSNGQIHVAFAMNNYLNNWSPHQKIDCIKAVFVWKSISGHHFSSTLWHPMILLIFIPKDAWFSRSGPLPFAKSIVREGKKGRGDEERERVPLRCRHWLRQLSRPLNIKGLHLGIEKSPYARFLLLTGPAGWFTLVFINLLTVEEAETVIGSESKGVSSGPCGWGRKPQTDRDRRKERWRKSMLRCHLVPLLLIILCSLLILTHCRHRAYINILIKPQLVVALTVLFLSVRCKIWIGH